MLKTRLFIGSMIAALVLMSCNFSLNTGNLTSRQVIGSGKRITETRTVSNFNAVELSVSGDLYVEQGESESLTIEADDNILPLLTSDVQGSRLDLGVKPNSSVSMISPIVYHLVIKDLTSIGINGSGKVIAKPIQTDKLSIRISGSGDVKFDTLTANQLSTHISGSGPVEISGTVNQQDISISGSGSYKAADLSSKDASIQISGSGNVTVWATDTLKVNVSGSGDVSYYGKPTVNSSSSGSGKIKSLGEK